MESFSLARAAGLQGCCSEEQGTQARRLGARPREADLAASGSGQRDCGNNPGARCPAAAQSNAFERGEARWQSGIEMPACYRGSASSRRTSAASAAWEAEAERLAGSRALEFLHGSSVWEGKTVSFFLRGGEQSAGRWYLITDLVREGKTVSFFSGGVGSKALVFLHGSSVWEGKLCPFFPVGGRALVFLHGSIEKQLCPFFSGGGSRALVFLHGSKSKLCPFFPGGGEQSAAISCLGGGNCVLFPRGGSRVPVFLHGSSVWGGKAVSFFSGGGGAERCPLVFNHGSSAWEGKTVYFFFRRGGEQSAGISSRI